MEVLTRFKEHGRIEKVDKEVLTEKLVTFPKEEKQSEEATVGTKTFHITALAPIMYTGKARGYYKRTPIIKIKTSGVVPSTEAAVPSFTCRRTPCQAVEYRDEIHPEWPGGLDQCFDIIIINDEARAFKSSKTKESASVQ